MIILVSGNVRTGKTLLLAIIALLFADGGGKVHSNFKLISDNARIIQPYDLVKMMLGERCLTGEMIVLQEVYAWLNSHKALSVINDFESTFVFQSGKMGYHILADSQITMRVDSSIRKLANVRFEAEKDESEECFRYWFLDVRLPNDDVRTGDYFEVPFAMAELFWNRYNTYDRTPPLGMARMVMEMERLEPKLMNASIERQVKLLLENRGKLVDCSKVSVESALLELDEVPVFASYVANRLKLRLR